MFFNNSQDIIREMTRVLRKPEELFELTLEQVYLGLLPCQCVPHILKGKTHRKGERSKRVLTLIWNISLYF